MSTRIQFLIRILFSLLILLTLLWIVLIDGLATNRSCSETTIRVSPIIRQPSGVQQTFFVSDSARPEQWTFQHDR